MPQVYKSMSLANPYPLFKNGLQAFFAILSVSGVSILILSNVGVSLSPSGLWLALSLALITVGVLGLSYSSYGKADPGIHNDGIWWQDISARGILGWIAGILITFIYILLYWYPHSLGLGSGDTGNTGLIALFDPLSNAIKGSPASQWFVYGTLYTLAILIFGVRFLWKYRHNKYQI